MTTEAPSTPRPNGPDPRPDRPAASAAPSRSAKLLGLARNLIAFGQALIHTLQASPAAGVLADIACRFGTNDLKLIIARITRGLMLAAALEARLVRCAARLDRRAVRPDAPRASEHRKRRPPTPVDTQSTNDAALLARMPTAQEIAASVRSKPIGIVLEEICRDFGIACDHPLWADLQQAILFNGGRLERILHGIRQRAHAAFVTMPEVFDAQPPFPSAARPPSQAATPPAAPPVQPRPAPVPKRAPADRRLDTALMGSRMPPPAALSYIPTGTGPP